MYFGGYYRIQKTTNRDVESLVSMTTRVVANRITRVPIAAQYLTRDLKSVLVTLLGRRNLLTLPVLRVLAHSSLDSINLQGSEVFDSSLDCLRVCHNLKFLTMPGAHVSSSCLIESFLDLPHLVKLDVASCHGVNDDVLQAIALNCPLIQLLILGKCCNFTDAGLKFLALHLRQLTVLDISHTKVTDNGLEALSKGFCSASLTELHIDGCTALTSKCGVYLQQLTNVSTLSFYNCPSLLESEWFLSFSGNQEKRVKNLSFTI